jgi:hypothetical protein
MAKKRGVRSRRNRSRRPACCRHRPIHMHGHGISPAQFIGTGGAGLGATIAGGMLGNGAYDTAKVAGQIVHQALMRPSTATWC